MLWYCAEAPGGNTFTFRALMERLNLCIDEELDESVGCIHSHVLAWQVFIQRDFRWIKRGQIFTSRLNPAGEAQKQVCGKLVELLQRRVRKCKTVTIRSWCMGWLSSFTIRYYNLLNSCYWRMDDSCVSGEACLWTLNPCSKYLHLDRKSPLFFTK